ncbi:MAG: M3 family oligoendopeptidase [Planctomycetota bacterium]|nr:M3 family oligoendopeptidase [Planctomycetota bacterium]
MTTASPFVGFSPASDWVPAHLDASRWTNLEPLFNDLRGRVIDSAATLERLIMDRSELDAAVAEHLANLYIATTRDTGDTARKDAYLGFVREVLPHAKRAGAELDRLIAESAFAAELPGHFEVYLRSMRREIELYREANIALQTEAAEADQKVNQVMGAWSVTFDGREHTLQHMAKYQESTDRDIRERAWRAVSKRRIQDRATLDSSYDALIGLRQRMAHNAGYENFRDFQHQNMQRFDYSVDDCLEFHDAIATHVVPLRRELDAQRSNLLKLDALRPWDLQVDVCGRDALVPFSDGQDLVERSVRACQRLDPELGEILAGLNDGHCLDLDSRKGKAPGGYQYQRQRTRRPFIFMNASSQQRDLTTMVHEAGHAFHSQLSRQEPLLAYRESPIEFAEVASMSMELLVLPYLDEFYSEDHANRHRRGQLERIIDVLPWVAAIDCFQHWIYTHEGHTTASRTRAWLDIDRRFGSAVDWSDCTEARDTQWQRQGHLYGSPFYYIEYGIAQLGALQLWAIAQQDERAAIDPYKAALSLGGSRPLPELFAAAGIEFSFSAAMIGRLMSVVREELASLPA